MDRSLLFIMPRAPCSNPARPTPSPRLDYWAAYQPLHVAYSTGAPLPRKKQYSPARARPDYRPPNPEPYRL